MELESATPLFAALSVNNVAWVYTLGWTLLHSLWIGALAAAAYYLLERFTRDSSPQWRHDGGVLLLVGSCMVLAGFCWSAWSDAPVAAASIVAAQSQPLLTSGAFEQTASQNWQDRISALLPYAVALWMIGVVLLSARLVLAQIGARRIRRVAERMPDLETIAAELCVRMGVNRAVEVLRTSRVKVPLVLGWLKPVILLPTGMLSGLSQEQIELVLVHELAHVRRHDYLINLFQLVLETLLFFNPGLRWISQRVRAAREECCDDLVVSLLKDRTRYARTLVTLEEMRFDAMSPALSMAGGELTVRVQRILFAPVRAQTSSALIHGTLSAALVVLAVLLGYRPSIEVVRDLGRLQLSSSNSDLPTVPLVDPRADRLLPRWQPVAAPVAIEQESQTVATEVTSLEDSALPSQPSAASEQALPTAWLPTSDRRSDLQALRENLLDAPLLIDKPLPLPVAASLDDTIRPLESVRPNYPGQRRLMGYEATITLSYRVNMAGAVSDIRVEDPSRTEHAFEKASRRALEQWRYSPADAAKLNGRRLEQQFDFRLGTPGQAAENDTMCAQNVGRMTCKTL